MLLLATALEVMYSLRKIYIPAPVCKETSKEKSDVIEFQQCGYEKDM